MVADGQIVGRIVLLRGRGHGRILLSEQAGIRFYGFEATLVRLCRIVGTCCVRVMARPSEAKLRGDVRAISSTRFRRENKGKSFGSSPWDMTILLLGR